MSNGMFCAICTGERGPFVQRPLGRGDALVPVCAACDDQPARSKRGPEVPYEIPERVIIGATVTAFARAADRVTGDDKATNRARQRGKSFARAAQPGFVIERVRRHPPGGETVDAKQARLTFEDRPWFAELRHIGSDRKWHLFERPDIDAARAARSGDDRDPLADVAAFAVRDVLP